MSGRRGNGAGVLVLLVVVIAGVVIAYLLSGRGSLMPGQAAQTAAPSDIPARATRATVEYVHDGDTLFLTDGRKVRLLGVNTPEIGSKAECYGEEATALLKQLLPKGTDVWVLSDVEPLDQYGRSLLFVYTGDGMNVNLELLRRGAAEVEMYRPNLLLQAEIEQTETDARNAGLGMWSSCPRR